MVKKPAVPPLKNPSRPPPPQRRPLSGAAAGPGGNGRPVGALGKVTASAKDTILDAAIRMGGAARLARWAQDSKENETLFWTVVYPRLIPLDVRAAATASGGAVNVGVQIVSYLDPDPVGEAKVINGHVDQVDTPAQPVAGKTVSED